MDFYVDECFPFRIARSLNEFDDKNRILSVVDKGWGGKDDLELVELLNKEKADFLLTQDKKFRQKVYQYKELNKNNTSVFVIKIASGANDELKWKTLVNKWDLILQTSKKEQRPFICTILRQKDPKGKPYHIL